MNFASVEKIADAVLYEGFMLYPYRRTALKNRQRWNFGTLYPVAYAEAQRPAEAFRFSTELLIEGDTDPVIDVRIRFLQLLPSGEAVERAANLNQMRLAELRESAAGCVPELVLLQRSPAQAAPPYVLPLQPVLLLRASLVDEQTFKLHLEFRNETPLGLNQLHDRETALLQSFVSAHAILGIGGGQFASLLDPPAHLEQAARSCRHDGVFPVLAGEEGSRSTVLCSPIILYDYPKTAPESPGDFFDGTEMDEMLALRVLTLTEEEKGQIRAGDSATRSILERTESLPQEHLANLHGAIRGLRPLVERQP